MQMGFVFVLKIFQDDCNRDDFNCYVITIVLSNQSRQSNSSLTAAKKFAQLTI